VKTIATIVILLLQLAKALADHLEKQNYTDDGYDKAKGELSAGILARSKHAKQIIESISGLSDSDTDKLLRDLEPKSS
jgi:hypothetical protein